MPAAVVEQLRQEFDEEERQLQAGFQGAAFSMERYNIQKKYFGRYDAYLDQMTHGPTWLRDPVIAGIVIQEMQRLHGTHYDIVAFCVMPNHVHLLVDCALYDDEKRDNKRHPSVLSHALKLLKGRSARYANQHLERSGSFWQDESYDHFVRDGGELERIVWYILNNPVKAGLVNAWDEWPYSFVTQDYEF